MIDDLLQKYIEIFGDSFPMYQIARGKTEKQVERLIKRCIKEKKDAYELGMVLDDEEVMY